MFTEKLSTKIVHNTLYNIIGNFWLIIVNLFLIPYIISHIGTERFGIWVLVSMITGYLSLLDIGISRSFVKYIAEYYTKKEYETINNIVNTGIVFFLVFGIIVILLSHFLIDIVIKFLKIPGGLYSEARFVFFVGIIIFCLTNIINVVSSIQAGLQRMDLTNKISILMSIPLIIGTIVFLERGYGLKGLVINQGLVVLLSGILYFIVSYKIFPYLRIKISYFNFSAFKQLFNFGIKLQVVRLESIFLFETDKLIISHFLTLNLVSFYTLGASIVNKIRNIPMLLCSAVLPTTSEISVVKDERLLHELYLRGSKYVTIVGYPILSFIFFTAPLIMLVWIGKIYNESVQVIRILVPAYLVNILTGVSSGMIVGMGKPEIMMRSSLLQFVVNLVLSIIFVIKIGFVGVVLATLISFSTISLWFMWMFHKEIRMPISQFVRTILPLPCIASFISGITVFFFNRVVDRLFIISSRFPAVYVLLIDVILFFFIYSYILLKYKTFDKYDILLFRNTINTIIIGKNKCSG